MLNPQGIHIKSIYCSELGARIMNNISAGLSASDGNQLVCDSCGVNLPTPTPNTELELEKVIFNFRLSYLSFPE